MNSLLNAVNVSKSYVVDGQENPVLKSVNLRIKRGDFISVMGPSGSGKSTLLYSLSGLDHLSSGSVEFKKAKLESMSEKKLSRHRLLHMGFIFQQIHLLKNLSVFDNIAVTAYLAGKNKPVEIRKRVEALMNKTGISELAGRDISQASGGQLQRAAICRALVNDPDIIFGDEPTGALNSRSANEIMDLLNGINQEGTTIMLVTHDVKVAARTDKVLYMRDGVILGEYDNKNNEAMPDREKVQTLSAWLYKMGF